MTLAPVRLLVVLLGALAVLALAGPASAHVGGGAAGSNFDGRVLSVTPEVPGISVRILQFGDELELVNETSTEVIVPGYSDEPYLRIGPDGVWRNANSPATYVNLDRFGRVDVPEHAEGRAAPDWVQVSTEPAYVWHDHRTHWMSENQLPPAVAADPGSAHTVFEWTVALVHGDTPVAGGRRADLEPAAVPLGGVAAVRWRRRCSRSPRGCSPARPGRWGCCCSSGRPRPSGTPRRRRRRRRRSPRRRAPCSRRCCRRSWQRSSPASGSAPRGAVAAR